MLAELNGKNNDAALVTYTWGLDLSGTFGGAGGVGGLLGISKKTVPTANLACLYDGNGNITQLVDMATGDSKAHYEYDPFGNLIQSELLSGLQTWNKFRFSTKQIEEELLIPTTSSSAGVSPNLYYYGYRFYSPRLGRWINQDPIGEPGGYNLYGFSGNNGLNAYDVNGLWFGIDDAIFALGGGFIGVVTQAVVDVFMGEVSDWEDYTGAFVGGAASGSVLLYTGNPILAGAAGGLTTSLVSQGIKSFTHDEEICYADVAITTVVGGMTGFIPGRPIQGVAKGRNSFVAVYNQIRTKAVNGTINRIRLQTAGKMFVGAAVKSAAIEGGVIGNAIAPQITRHFGNGLERYLRNHNDQGTLLLNSERNIIDFYYYHEIIIYNENGNEIFRQTYELIRY